MNLKRITLALLLVSPLPCPSSFATCPDAISFPGFSTLSARQQELISTYLPDAGSSFQAWAEANNGQATEVLANTQALSYLKLQLSSGEWVVATTLIKRIKDIRMDRIKVELNPALFDSWRKAGAKFELSRINGKTETGNFDFDHGDLGGSRHKHYDVQGYTSYMHLPRIQMNYRASDNEADIDLDAYHPWIFSVVPNPRHLTFSNSDPRCWLGHYEKKFGKLGVVLRKRNFKDLITQVGEGAGEDLEDNEESGARLQPESLPSFPEQETPLPAAHP